MSAIPPVPHSGWGALCCLALPVASLWRDGTVVVLSDGDPVFQPLKIFRAGITDAVRGNVLVFSRRYFHPITALFASRQS